MTHTHRIVAAGLAGLFAMPALGADDPFDHLPPTLKLTGVIRDFRDSQVQAGHPDFNMVPNGGAGHYLFMVEDELGDDGKPVFRCTGQKVTGQWKDRFGRNISPPKGYIQPRWGDASGNTNSSANGACQGQASFDQWYRDIVGVNMSGYLDIRLERQAGTPLYVFDDTLDMRFLELEGFYNTNGQFPSAQGGNKNWSFTYEIETTFRYIRGADQYLTFAGDDDIWVFIDGKLVIDIGGVHDRVEQTIELDRLAQTSMHANGFLVDGEEYTMKIFFAERNKPRSELRIETTLNLRGVDLPPVSALYD